MGTMFFLTNIISSIDSESTEFHIISMILKGIPLSSTRKFIELELKM